MRTVIIVGTLVVSGLMLGASASAAEESTGEQHGIPLTELIERASARLHKNFIVDPRVSGEARLFGIDPDRITFRELQAVLAVHGLVATQESNGLIAIIPDANARQIAQPVVTEPSANLGKDEVVTRAIDVGPLDATQLVPVLRPLLPQQAHMVAVQQTNTLIVVDRYDNVRRIEAIIKELQKRPVSPPPAR